MPGSKVRSPRATTLLRKDHDRIRGLFTLYERLGPEAESARKLRILDEIRVELGAHAVLEDQLFYPALEGSGEEQAGKAVDAAFQSHLRIRSLLSELDDLDPDDETFDGKMEELSDVVESHVVQEEDLLFEIFHRLPQDVQDEIAESLRSRQEERS